MKKKTTIQKNMKSKIVYSKKELKGIKEPYTCYRATRCDVFFKIGDEYYSLKGMAQALEEFINDSKRKNTKTT